MMKKCKTVAVDRYAFSGKDRILVDANVWLYVYGPQANPREETVRKYSAAVKNMLDAKSTIYIDILILSEVINRYSRMEYNIFNPESEGKGFKDFRRSPEYRPIIKAITEDVRRICGRCSFIGTELASSTISGVLAKLEDECHDFNDIVLAEICRSNGCLLLTHDLDFLKFDLTLLTANHKLLVA